MCDKCCSEIVNSKQEWEFSLTRLRQNGIINPLTDSLKEAVEKTHLLPF